MPFTTVICRENTKNHYELSSFLDFFLKNRYYYRSNKNTVFPLGP